jgi:hypothetical protein
MKLDIQRVFIAGNMIQRDLNPKPNGNISKFDLLLLKDFGNPAGPGNLYTGSNCLARHMILSSVRLWSGYLPSIQPLPRPRLQMLLPL